VGLKNQLVEAFEANFSELSEQVGLDQVFLDLGRIVFPVRLF